jgi:hypothetical protein
MRRERMEEKRKHPYSSINVRLDVLIYDDIHLYKLLVLFKIRDSGKVAKAVCPIIL